MHQRMRQNNSINQDGKLFQVEMQQSASQISYAAILGPNLRTDGLACLRSWIACYWLVLWDKYIQTLTDPDLVHTVR